MCFLNYYCGTRLYSTVSCMFIVNFSFFNSSRSIKHFFNGERINNGSDFFTITQLISLFTNSFISLDKGLDFPVFTQTHSSFISNVDGVPSTVIMNDCVPSSPLEGSNISIECMRKNGLFIIVSDFIISKANL
jgi:hypothetical protein